MELKLISWEKRKEIDDFTSRTLKSMTGSCEGDFNDADVQAIIGAGEDAKLIEQAEVSFKAGRISMAKELYDEVICPMCYRLNPQHASMDNGIGCKSCEEKENWLGEQK